MSLAEEIAVEVERVRAEVLAPLESPGPARCEFCARMTRDLLGRVERVVEAGVEADMRDALDDLRGYR